MVSDPAARLKLQIVAENMPVPWGPLYVGDASSGARLDWDNFMGMRHIIERIPLQNTLTVSDPGIPSDKPQLMVSLNVNSGIDTQMHSDFVAQQQAFWADAKASRKRVRVTAQTTSAEVVKALADGATEDQILYFYCHAESSGLTDPGGPDTSCLVLTDASITLGDLNLDAPTTTLLRGNPLVFVNTCESAEMPRRFTTVLCRTSWRRVRAASSGPSARHRRRSLRHGQSASSSAFLTASRWATRSSGYGGSFSLTTGTRSACSTRCTATGTPRSRRRLPDNRIWN
jgi:hypothetical protein